MKNKLTLFAALMTLGACATETPRIENGEYWQRVSASEAIYLQGPKAQQKLNRAIAQCVVALRELERLGMVKEAVPTDYEGKFVSEDERALLEWDTPERDETLFIEHADFQDFESCMLQRGWERVLHVPYNVAQKSQGNYYRAHVDYDYQNPPARYTPENPTSNNQGQYGDFNE